MRSIGFEEVAMQRIWMLLSVILKLGNLRFGSGEEAQRPAEDALQELGQQLRLDPSAFGKALVEKRLKAGGEWIATPNSAEAAVHIRDGLAKARTMADTHAFY